MTNDVEQLAGWKSDRLGWYLEMDPGGRKDWALDWTLFIAGGAIATATWTLGSGVSSVQETTSGAITQIWLLAGAAAARVSASCTLTLAGTPTLRETFTFRIIVRSAPA